MLAMRSDVNPCSVCMYPLSSVLYSFPSITIVLLLRMLPSESTTKRDLTTGVSF